MCKTDELLKIEDISLNYGNLEVLHDINLTINKSGVHAVVGEHGAGKSSLAKVIAGELRPRTGRLFFKEKYYNYLTVKKAKNIGIEIVNQINQLYDRFTVADNLFVTSRFLNSLPVVHQKRLNREAKSLLSTYNFDIDPSSLLIDLTLSDRVLVDILRSLYAKPRLLILDEALEKLSANTLSKVIVILKRLNKEGMAILFVTHRLDDIYDFADMVSVIKNGRILITDNINKIDKINLIKIAYIQLEEHEDQESLNKEFYELLKYNEAILRNLPVNLLVTDKDNKIRLINENGKKYFGLQSSAFRNLPLETIFPRGNDEALGLLKDALGKKQENAFYNVVINLGERKTTNVIKIYPIYDGAFFIGNIIILEDITEQDKLREQVLISEKLASVGLLAAGVAHEINNPLEIIYNYVKYLKFNSVDHKVQEVIENLDRQIHYIANIVSNLITFSDSTTITIKEIDLNETIQNMLGLIKYDAKYKKIAIHFDKSEDTILMRMKENEIKQVILNLFKNSFEAMPKGGRIYIKTEEYTNNESRYIRIIFRDTGPGIEESNLYNIFLPFYSTKSAAGTNLGLGLSVSYGIVKKYNGTITVENLRNSGCQFTITMPKAVVDAATE
jgi:signal transduction histidine kinase/ABC-type branched-subunit amino acid transport system ATPase component